MPAWRKEFFRQLATSLERPKYWMKALTITRVVAVAGVAFYFWTMASSTTALTCLVLGIFYSLGIYFLHLRSQRGHHIANWWLSGFFDTLLLLLFISTTGGRSSPFLWLVIMPPFFGCFLNGPLFGLLLGIVLTVFHLSLYVGGTSAELFHGIVLLAAMWSLYGVNSYLLSSERQARLEANRQMDRNRDLEALAGAKLQFISIASHELRTPLTVIKGYNHLMKSMVTVSEDLLEFNQEITRAIDRMESLIEDLLEFGRLESGQLKLVCRETMLDQLARDVVGAISVLASQKQQRLELDLPTMPIIVSADPRRVEQVLINLLNNALKYSPPESMVILKMSVLVDTIRVEVTDQGPGIAPEHQPHLFSPFYRAQAEGSSTPGIGLGLAICQGIIHAHGGQLGLTSRAGMGTTFWFELPKVERPDQVLAEARAM